ncbi:MAG: secondary thiamine-phosphate synthase enzyme YjbQ [Phycisphaerales bacterium]
MVVSIKFSTARPGLHDITSEVTGVIAEATSQHALSSDGSGLCTLFLRHTSASLIIQENADPSARRDLEAWLDRLVPERDPLFTHTTEGPDDMPSHIKAVLTAGGASLAIPIASGRLALGTWQGIFLWEHRRSPHAREIVVHVGP